MSFSYTFAEIKVYDVSKNMELIDEELVEARNFRNSQFKTDHVEALVGNYIAEADFRTYTNIKSTTDYSEEWLDNKYVEKGCPDLAVLDIQHQKNNELFFVEVKRDSDSLRPSQIEWMSNHDKRVCIAVVEEFEDEKEFEQNREDLESYRVHE